MLTLIIAAIVVIALTVGIVWLIDQFIPKKFKSLILLTLWVIIIALGYLTFMSVYGEIKFNKLKNDRYLVVIENLKDIRDSQLAHRAVTGKFANNWDSLVVFIDSAEFTITQRRDTTVLDKELTKRYGGVETFKSTYIIDTLGTMSVKDSLFGADLRYQTMMNIPVGKEGATFELQAGTIEQNGLNIPVFEAKGLKSLILYGEDANLIAKENQVISVDGVNGNALIVGSMEEVNTNGNWPKNFSNEQ
ncbi:MAG: hypothetical protein P8P73_10940 [Flavobacteriaceae bacterium]|jgi:hypothetical protein|nr:hypothetical protein [Flavobacteriaceae bacterium]MDG1380509.1 hypothetical protein [Flavobacteriaceae bacterium]MDG2349422.1 hypothetical protein [Flavobacteriaceae bacterium]